MTDYKATIKGLRELLQQSTSAKSRTTYLNAIMLCQKKIKGAKK